MHRGPKITAFLAIATLWLGTLSVAQAQGSDPDEAEPPQQEREAKAEAEPPSEPEEAVEPDEAAASDESYKGGDQDDDEAGVASGEAFLDEDVDEEAEEPEEVGRGQGDGEVGLELAFYLRSDHLGNALDLSPLLSGWYAITDDLDITLDWGFVFDSYVPEQGKSAGNFMRGNPFLSVRRVMQEGRTRIWFGIGANVPISSVPAEDEDGYPDKVRAYDAASAMRGNWDQWLWMPEHFGIVVPLGARMVSEDHLLLGGETAFYFLSPVDDYGANRSDFYIQLAGDIGFGWRKVVTGLRLQGVITTTNADADRLQSAIGPFVRYDMRGAFFTARFLLNLDEPAGIFGDRDLWALYLGGGATF